MPANNTTHDRTSIHSQQEEKTRRKCQRTWKSFVRFVFVAFVGVVGVSEERCEQEESDGVKGGDGFDFGGKTCGV